jgi:hypothetical protein
MLHHIRICHNVMQFVSLIALFVASALSLSATTYYVSPTGNDGYSGLASNTPLASIWLAISKVKPGDLILLEGGTYYPTSPMSISAWLSGTPSAPITMSNAPGQTVIIDGQYTCPANDTTNIYTGPTVVNGGVTYTNGQAFTGSSQAILTGYVSNWKLQGITIQHSEGNAILWMTAAGYPSVQNVSIVNCQFVTNRGGATFFIDSSNVQISNCLARGDNNFAPFARTATQLNWGSIMNFARCTNVLVQGCVVGENWGEGIGAYWNATNITFQDNVAYDNYPESIYLNNTSKGLVQRNLVYHTTNALFAQGNMVGIMIADETSSTGLGHDRTIINNLVMGNYFNFQYWQNSAANPLSRLQNDVIAYNTFVDAISYSLYISPAANPAGHTNTLIANNLFAQTGAASLQVNVPNDPGLIFSHNAWTRSLTGVSGASTAQGQGDVIGDPRMYREGSTAGDLLTTYYFLLHGSSPLFGMSLPVTNVLYDYFNNPRGASASTIGALISTNFLAPLPVFSPSNTVPPGQAMTVAIDPAKIVGTPPFTYQWLKNTGTGFTNLPNATNTLAAYGNAGPIGFESAEVMVFDTNGVHATSDPAVLTVALGTLQLYSKQMINVAPAPTFNLTQEGDLDWSKWGGLSGSVPGLIQKASGGSPVNLIGTYKIIGVNNTQAYTGAAAGLNWADGTPTASAANIATGVFFSQPPNGFELDVPAAQTNRVLNVYIGSYHNAMHIHAAMSDNSAAPIVDDTAAIGENDRYSILFAAGSPGQNLIFQVTCTTNTTYNNFNVGIEAASLSSPLAVAAPVLAPTNVVTAGNPVTMTASAVGTPPLSYQWLVSSNGGAYAAIASAKTNVWSVTNPVVAVYSYELVVTNSQGAVTSAPAVLTVMPAAPGTIGAPIPGPGAGQYTLTWTNARALLLQAQEVTGPWTTNNAVSPYTFAATNSRMFFRLQGK